MSNLLKYSKSPYLLQHKDNPVHWRMWNQETLDLAKKENKIILVSIGYSTCHWCHVMAHESFEDEEIASVMNKYFINVKIDREERPDLDHYFMQCVQVLGISGGWPLNCFLTPDQKVFYGGTYFPPITKYNRIAWPDLLVAIQRSFTEKNESIIKQAEKLNQTVKVLAKQPVEVHSKNSNLNINNALEHIDKFIDFEKGGFGFGQKFPNTTGLSFLLQANQLIEFEKYWPFLKMSIRKMFLGGMYDHLQGAFYRYTVDRDWKIPHFEKMAYDHALIMGFLAELYNKTKSKLYTYFIKNSIHFWYEEMRSSKNLYFAAMDADSEGEEGLYYLWTEDEIKQILKVDSAQIVVELEFAKMHDQSSSVLNFLNLESRSDEEIVAYFTKLQSDFLKLAEVRSKRPRPSTDTKHILGWNALIASNYCRVYLSTFEDDYKEKALNLIDAILQHFLIDKQSGNYCRIYLEDDTQSGFAFLEDYAYLSEALFHAYQVSGNQTYLDELFQVLNKIEQLFDSNRGLYSFSSSLHTDGVHEIFDIQDSSLPNANAVLAQLKYYLYLIGFDIKYYSQYQEMYQQVIGHIELNYFSHLSWLSLSPEILESIVVLKASNTTSAFEYSKLLDLKNVLYFYTDELTAEEIQICTQRVCYPAVKTFEEATQIMAGIIKNE
ncbi:MAG: thioredoxin domain-containing protein [Saprospiraceae bacterium]